MNPERDAQEQAIYAAAFAQHMAGHIEPGQPWEDSRMKMLVYGGMSESEAQAIVAEEREERVGARALKAVKAAKEAVRLHREAVSRGDSGSPRRVQR